MSRRLLGTLVVVACGAAAVAAVAFGFGTNGVIGRRYDRALDPERCAIKSSDAQQTIASNDYGRVWVHKHDGRTGYNVRNYACSNHWGRHFLLGTAHEDSYEGDEPHKQSTLVVDFNYRYAVAAKRTCTSDVELATCGSRIEEIDLKDGEPTRKPISRSHAFVVDVLMLSTGETRFVYGLLKPREHNDRCEVGCEIHVASRSYDRVIASGPDLDLGSIALSGIGYLFWRQGGEPHVKRVFD
jgi:hypothetical protein